MRISDYSVVKTKAKDILPCDFMPGRGSVIRTLQIGPSVFIEYKWTNGIELWDFFDGERTMLIRRK